MVPNNSLLSQDRLVLFGYGLFETLLITEHGPQFVDLHWQRMNRGADILGLNMPAIDQWLKLIQEFIEQNPCLFPYALRITLSGGVPETMHPSQFLLHRRVIPYTPAQYESGIKLCILPTLRNEHSPLTSIKSTNYLENILAKEKAKKEGADEGLWLNTKGNLCEGTMSNLFFIKKGIIFTPSLQSGCLPGTRRQLILRLADFLKIPTEQGLYPMSDLLEAEAIFMTNALMGLMPVHKIDNYIFSPIENPIFKALQAAYHELMTNPPHRSF